MRGIIIGYDITKVDEEYTVATACKQKHINEEIIVLDMLRVNPYDPNGPRKLREFALKWHPNFLRRWLFRLFKI